MRVPASERFVNQAPSRSRLSAAALATVCRPTLGLSRDWGCEGKLDNFASVL
jgi:hypothetical protein